MENSSINEIHDIIKAIVSGEKSILNVVEEAQEDLTSLDPAQRESAIEKLSGIITGLPHEALTTAEVKTLLEFFCAKLKDSVLLASPAIGALHHLVINAKNCPKDAHVDILKVLLREQEVQSCPQSDRILIYQVLDHILHVNAESICMAMASDFILGFLQSADGERDPRCLLAVFRIFCKTLDQVPLGPFASDMFEMVACYFPIDFKPPPNDPYGIKPDQLSLALRRCLTGHQGFSHVCLDLISEKLLEEQDEKARKEIWVLLNDALEVFGTEVINTYATGLWQHIRAEALKPLNSNESREVTDAHICTNLALTALGTMAKRMCEATGHEKVNEVAEKMFHDCEPFLIDIEMHLLKPASNILMSAARSEDSVCAILCGKVVSLLMERVQRSRTVLPTDKPDVGVWDEERGTGSRVAQAQYAPTLAAWIELANEMNCGQTLEYLIDAFVTLVLTQLSRSSVAEVVEAGFHIAKSCLRLSLGQEQLSEPKLIDLAEAAVKCYLTSEPKQFSLKKSCISFCRELSVSYWPLLEKDLLTRITDNWSETKELTGLLGALIHNAASCDVILPETLKLFSESSEEKIYAGLSGIECVLEWNPDNAELPELMWQPVLDAIFTCGKTLFIGSLVEKMAFGSLVEKMAFCAQDVFLRLPQNSLSESRCIDECFKVIEKSETNDISSFKLIEPILCSVTPNSSQSVSERLSDLLDKRKELRNIFFVTQASLANKLLRAPSKDSITGSAEDLVGALKGYIDERLEENKREAVTQLGWLTRALMLRNFQPVGSFCLRQLMDFLCDPDVGEEGVRACSCVYDDSEHNLISPTRTRAVGTFLYKQRILSQSMPVLLESYQAVKIETARQYYFIVLGQLLRYAPQGSTSELGKLVPVLIRALQRTEVDCTLEPVVSAVKELLKTTETAKPLELHLESVTDRLLQLARSHKNMEMRVDCVECLGLVAVRFPPSVLFPLRKKLMKGLGEVLDDHKRIVRKAAVEAKNKW